MPRLLIALVVISYGLAGARSQEKQAGGDLEAVVRPFLRKYCVKCHRADRARGEVRLDQLPTDTSAKLDLFAQIVDLIDTRAMPPKSAQQQPTQQEKVFVSESVLKELRRVSHGSMHARQLPSKGNYVDHQLLFGATARDAEASPARIWRLNPHAYWSYLETVTGSRLEKARWNDNGGLMLPRIPFAEPLSMKNDGSPRDYAFRYSVTGTEIEQLVGNARLALPIMFESKSFREETAAIPTYWFKGGKDKDGKEKLPRADDVRKTVELVFKRAVFRAPTEEELERYTTFALRRVEKFGAKQGMIEGLVPLLTKPEVIFRAELGRGEADGRGRSLLAPDELARAMAYGLRDSPPDKSLLAAVEEGRLKTREDVLREVDRLLGDPETAKRKTLRFFREYFDYPLATEVFKDGAELAKYRIHPNEYTPVAYIQHADALVLHILESDRDVLKELLTYPTGSSGYPRNEKEADWILKQEKTLTGMLMQKAWLIAHGANFDNHPIKRGHWIRERLLGDPLPDVPITVAAQLPDDPKRTLRERMELTREAYCWKCHAKMDPLGLPFEQFNHFGRLRKDDFGRPIDTTGEIHGMGEGLDGPVASAKELIERLATSERVEQVFVRHAFRFWLGRNETPGDAATLQAAWRCYRDSGGSMKALIRSLVSSDAFLYRNSGS